MQLKVKQIKPLLDIYLSLQKFYFNNYSLFYCNPLYDKSYYFLYINFFIKKDLISFKRDWYSVNYYTEGNKMKTTFTKEYCNIAASKCNKNCKCIEYFHKNETIYCKIKPMPEFPELIYICDNNESIQVNCPYSHKYEEESICECAVRIELYHYGK